MDQQGLSIFDRIADASFRNRNVLLGLIVLIALGAAGYYGWTVTAAKKEEKAMAAYSAGEKAYQTSAVAKPETDKAATAPDNSQAVAQFNKVLADYPGTKASYLAAFRLSDIYAAQKDDAKTTEVLEPIVQKANAQDLIIGMMALKLSGLYEKKQQCDKAVPVLQKIADQKNPMLKPEAYLRLGLCYENLNQKEKAVEFYQKLSQEFSDSTQGQQAQKYLKLLNS